VLSSTNLSKAPSDEYQPAHFRRSTGLTKVVPFLVEDAMLKRGAIFSKKTNWADHVVSDGLLITGQNPHSSGRAAQTLMAAVRQKAEPIAPALGLRRSNAAGCRWGAPSWELRQRYTPADPNDRCAPQRHPAERITTF